MGSGKVIVFRVEHKETNDGPYQGTNAIMDDPALRHTFDHPTPNNDGIDPNWWMWHADDSWLCGFNGYKQFAKWFYKNSSNKNLRERGFVLRRYQVPKEEIKFGRMQVVFNRQCAKLVGEQPVKVY